MSFRSGEEVFPTIKLRTKATNVPKRNKGKVERAMKTPPLVVGNLRTLLPTPRTKSITYSQRNLKKRNRSWVTWTLLGLKRGFVFREYTSYCCVQVLMRQKGNQNWELSFRIYITRSGSHPYLFYLAKKKKKWYIKKTAQPLLKRAKMIINKPL